MKHYKGLLCGLAAVVLVLGAVRIVSLNKALPGPEDKPVTVGEKFIYLVKSTRSRAKVETLQET